MGGATDELGSAIRSAQFDDVMRTFGEIWRELFKSNVLRSFFCGSLILALRVCSPGYASELEKFIQTGGLLCLEFFICSAECETNRKEDVKEMPVFRLVDETVRQ